MGFRSRVVVAALRTSANVIDPHKGAVLPEGRIAVIAVPLAALASGDQLDFFFTYEAA